MKHRWTIKELANVTDKDLIKSLINERLSELNGYCPLAERLELLKKNLHYNKIR
jgi:hypothetical protein